MSERVFTVYEGPDAGLAFLLADNGVTIGRDAKCDVKLNDDRASRVHARLILENGRVVLVDEGSSNGTLVNGSLIRRFLLKEGDAFVIGDSHIVFGRKRPDTQGLVDAALAGALSADRAALPGEGTEVLSEEDDSLKIHVKLSNPMQILEAVADAAEPAAAPLKIRIIVEPLPENSPLEQVMMDPQLVYRALAAAVACSIQAFASNERTAGGSLLLRIADDPKHSGFMFEVRSSALRVPRERIHVLAREGAFRDSATSALAHSGDFQLMPVDAPDTLVRLCLPGKPASPDSATFMKLT